MSVVDDNHLEPSVLGDAFRKKKLKLTPSQIHMRTTTHTEVSEQTPLVIRVTVDSPSKNPSHHSNRESVFVSSHNADMPSVGTQVDPIVSNLPKVSRASRLYIFYPRELNSILLRFSQTLHTPVAL